MPILPNEKQFNGLTLQAFYHDISLNPEWKPIGKQMIKLIQKIDRTFKKTPIWGITADFKLILLSEDDYRSPWRIAIENHGDADYVFRYICKFSQQKFRITQHTAHNLREAIYVLSIAIHKSGAWQCNDEILHLVQQAVSYYKAK